MGEVQTTLGLALEVADGLGISRHQIAEELQRHGPIQFGIPRPPDHAHPTTSSYFLQKIAAEHPPRRQQVAHGGAIRKAVLGGAPTLIGASLAHSAQIPAKERSQGKDCIGQPSRLGTSADWRWIEVARVSRPVSWRPWVRRPMPRNWGPCQVPMPPRMTDNSEMRPSRLLLHPCIRGAGPRQTVAPDYGRRQTDVTSTTAGFPAYPSCPW